MSAAKPPAENPALVTSPDAVRALFLARARAEIAAADALAPGSDVVASRGSLLADVAAIKGLPGPAEASGGAALSGADGEALKKALEALGWDAGRTFATLSRPEPGLTAPQRAERLRLQVEAVDARLVLALDGEAAADLAEAFGIAMPAFGVEVRVAGRRLLAVDGFETSLGDPARKKRVWRQLQSAKPDGAVY